MFFRNLVSNVTNIRAETVDLQDRRLLELLGVTPDEINLRGKNALKEATVYACVKILSEAVAKLPCKVYQETPKGIKAQGSHPLYPLLKIRPNPYMTAIDMFKATEVQRDLHGNSYIIPEIIQSGSNRGKIKHLWPVDAEKVQIWVDDKGLFSTQKRVWYIISLAGDEVKLHSDEVLHFKFMTLDGITGIPPVTYLKFLMEAGASGTQYIRDFFKQGLQAKGIVHYTGDLNKEAEENFRTRFERMASGLKNAHRVALLPFGYQFQPVQLSMTDAQFLENSQLTITQIANAFGVKLHQLNNLDRSTHTNVTEQQKQFYSDTLLAILTMYEQEMTFKLFTPSEYEQGFYIKFNADSILRSDLETRYEAYRKGIQGSMLKPNEAREKEELPPIDGGDEILVNKAMVPLSHLLKSLEEGGKPNEVLDD